MICHIVKAVVNHGDRVLICLPTAASIWDFLENVDKSSNLGDILVLNKNSELKNNNTFGKAFLGNRSHELYCCLSFWKSWVKEMHCLLDLSGYHANCSQSDECTICSNEGLIKFSLSSFAERFENIVGLLKSCFKCIVKELSVISLSDCDARKANELLDVIHRFDHQLHNQSLNDETVQATFGLLDVHDETFDDATAKKLNATRIDCLQLLDTLLTSLKLPQLNSREEVDKFCITHSRVIVSTPDCASQLHGLDMKPFQVLIVGHAGLINEIELLIPVNLPLVHAVLLGDDQHRQPELKSKVSIKSIRSCVDL
jgi:senataxin